MTPAQRMAVEHVRLMQKAHYELMVMAARYGEPPQEAQDKFSRRLRQAMLWTAILGAIAIWRIGFRKSPEIPVTRNGKVKAESFFLANPQIAAALLPLIQPSPKPLPPTPTEGMPPGESGGLDERAADVADTEMRYILDRLPGMTPEKIIRAAAVRSDAIRRTVLGEVRQDAIWKVLGIPSVLENVPFCEYRSAHIPTTRPTHAAMSGFVAQTTSKIWTTVRPLCGYNCLCYLTFRNRLQAEHEKLLNPDGSPKFELRWPSRTAQFNYESGRFPDLGWSGPKPTIYSA